MMNPKLEVEKIMKHKTQKYNRRINDELWNDTYARDVYFGLQNDVAEEMKTLQQTHNTNAIDARHPYNAEP